MSTQYESLFNIYFKHDYFKTGVIDTINIKPTQETIKLFRDYELVLKFKNNSFSIHYPTIFASENNTRNKVLSDKIQFDFTIECKDNNFFNYTDFLGDQIENKMFLFEYPNDSNKLNYLHAEVYVSNIELLDYRKFENLYFSKPFGHLKIITDSNFPIDNFIQFKSPSLYWRYIIRTPYLIEYKNLAICNKNKTEFFEGPKKITLPNGESALSFVSPTEIKQLEFSDLHYQLLEEYDKETNYGKVLLPNLPHPNNKSITYLGEENKIEGKNRILDIVI
jgi:hypothetical protein